MRSSLVVALALGAAVASAQTAGFEAWPCDRALLAAATVPGGDGDHLLTCQDDGKTIWLHTWADKARGARRVNETVSTEVPDREIRWHRGFTKLLNSFDQRDLRSDLKTDFPWLRLARLDKSSSAPRNSVIESLEIRNLAGGVQVTVTDTPKPQYQVFGLAGERLSLSACRAFGPVGGALFVDCSGDEAVILEIEVPRRLRIGVETQTGAITVIGHPEDLRMATASGAIELRLDPDREVIEGQMIRRPHHLSLSSRVAIRGDEAGLPFNRALVNRPAIGCSPIGLSIFHPMFGDDMLWFGGRSGAVGRDRSLIASDWGGSPKSDRAVWGLDTDFGGRHCQVRRWEGTIRLRAGQPVSLRVQTLR